MPEVIKNQGNSLEISFQKLTDEKIKVLCELADLIFDSEGNPNEQALSATVEAVTFTARKTDDAVSETLIEIDEDELQIAKGVYQLFYLTFFAKAPFAFLEIVDTKTSKTRRSLSDPELEKDRLSENFKFPMEPKSKDVREKERLNLQLSKSATDTIARVYKTLIK